MRARFIAPLLLLAAFAAVPAAAQVEGRYRLTSIDGQALPTASPTEADVTVQRTSFIFQADGRFFMQMRAASADEVFSDARQGTYRVDGDSLRLYPEGEEDAPIVHRWTVEGGTMHLCESGHDYAFAAAPVPTAADLHGSYRATHINGHPLPYTATSEDVTAVEMRMVLQPDGAYSLHLEARSGGGMETRDVSGTYEVEGDGLLLRPGAEAADSGTAEFLWTLDGTTLLLVDETDDEYTFVRQ